MYSLDTGLLKKKFSKVSDPSYPDQEVYPNLPPEVDGEWQPQSLGVFTTAGFTLPELFLNATPTVIIDPGIDNGDGTWQGRKFKITAKVKNPETGFVHGCQAPMQVLRYQNEIVSIMTPGTAGSGNHYQLSDNNTQIDFHNTNAGKLQNEAQIRVYSAAALLDDSAGTFTGNPNTQIWNVPDVIHLLLVCFGSVPTVKINIGSMTVAGVIKQGMAGTFTAPPWFTSVSTLPIRAHFNRQITIQELIDILAFSIGHKLVIDSDGRYALRQLKTFATASTVTLTEPDISNWSENLRLDSFQNRIIVKYLQVPGGEQEAQFDVTKKKRKKKRKTETFETEAFYSVRNSLIKLISGVSVKDDLLYAIGKEAEPLEVITFWVSPQPAQDLANYLYQQWGRGNWKAACIDVDGLLANAFPGDLAMVHRPRSAYGDISNGKLYRLIDATSQLSNNLVDIHRIDEVK